MSLDNLPTLSETVRHFDLGANKKLGQHFLLDMNVTDKIARLAAPLAGINCVEIGPGPGGLTRSLLKAGANSVLAIEMDERFIPALALIREAADNRLRILRGDALNVDIYAEVGTDIKIIANLPYNVGTKLLINWLLARPFFWSQAILMFQKEVAERVAAVPGDKAYGRLAILAQSVCTTRMAFDVPARAFSPPPKVDSAVIILDPLPEHQRYCDLKLLGQVTEATFGQRRKMLRRSLKGLAGQHNMSAENWLNMCDIDPQRRPETLSISEFHRLSDALKTR